MSVEEISSQPGHSDAIATIEIKGAPDEVLQRIESSQDGVCTVSLAASGAVSGEELRGSDGNQPIVADSSCRGDEAASSPVDRSSTNLSPGDGHRDVMYAVRQEKTRTPRHLNDLGGMYRSTADLRRDFAASLININLLPQDFVIKDDNFFIGFIRPGHGAKGQKVSIACDVDVARMYEVCRSRRNDIILWYSLSKEAARAYEDSDIYIPSVKMKPKHPGLQQYNLGGKRKPQTSPVSTAASTTPGMSPTAASARPACLTLSQTPTTRCESMQVADSVLPVTQPSPACHPASYSLPKRRYTAIPEPHGGGSLAASPNRLTRHSSATSLYHLSPSLGPVTTPTQPYASSGDVLADSCATPVTVPAVWSLRVVKERAETRKWLIEQLKDWADLFQSGVITEEVYTNHKTKILADLEKL